MEYKTILWDWNGTLLNDTGICIDVMNGMLQKHGMPLISIEKYRSVFTFPVKEYYEAVGWNFATHKFEIIGHQFIDGYRVALPEATLFNDAHTVLERFHISGMQQHILSAMEAEFLLESVADMGISKYFKSINGITNHLAKGKLDIAREMQARERFDVSATLIIGDTLHDGEIAKALGCDCILVASGHQNHARLKQSGFPVVEKLEDIPEIIKI
jgi:phosphoglycolate phosphatase